MTQRRGRDRHESEGRGGARGYREAAQGQPDPGRRHGYDPAHPDYDRPWASAAPAPYGYTGYGSYGGFGGSSGRGPGSTRFDEDRPWTSGGEDDERFAPSRLPFGPEHGGRRGGAFADEDAWRRGGGYRDDRFRGYGESIGVDERPGHAYPRGDSGDFGDRAEGFGSRARPHHGKSPMGYTRSDERIREDVCDRLMQGSIDPSRVAVRVSEGEVTLEGSVEDRRAKHLLENVASSVAGVKDVDNRLKIRGRDDDDSAQAGAGRSPSRSSTGSSATRS